MCTLKYIFDLGSTGFVPEILDNLNLQIKFYMSPELSEMGKKIICTISTTGTWKYQF